MADGSKPPKAAVTEELIIVRRSQPEDAGHKGGAWKIAYADFVTAMMAFFLVMWLINAANEKTKAQVASYFNPVKLVDNTTSTKGIKTPGDRTANSSGQNGGDAPPSAESQEAKPAEKSGEKPAEAEHAKPAEETATAHGNSTEEAAIFDDPFKLLSQLAREAPTGSDGKSDKTLVIKETEIQKPVMAGETRDPFDPLSWKLVPPAEHKGEAPAEAPKLSEAEKPREKTPDSKEPESKTEPKKSEDLGDGLSPAGRLALREAEQIRTSLSNELAGLGTRHPDLQVKTTKEGVLISLTDSASFDMFDVGSAKPRPVVVKLMEKVAAAVKNFKGQIVVRGHTDGRPYRGNGYDNWRLSIARAQMAYYMLIRAGVDENVVQRIEGYADKSLLDKKTPESAENRRIEILLRVSDP